MPNVIGDIKGGKFLLASFEASAALKPGAYRYDMCSLGCIMFTEEMSGEAIRECNSSQEALFRIIDKFWASAKRYAEMGVPHKTGVLLHGVPGTGKTVVLRKAIALTVQAGGFAIKLGSLSELPQCIGHIRHHYPSAPVLVYCDDMDSWLRRDHDHEVELTHLMDGTGKELDGCMVIATTNHLEQFSERLRRPGRFDYVVEIDPPNQEERQKYLAEIWKVPFNHKACEAVAAGTEGVVLSTLRAVAIQAYIHGLDEVGQDWVGGALGAAALQAESASEKEDAPKAVSPNFLRYAFGAAQKVGS